MKQQQRLALFGLLVALGCDPAPDVTPRAGGQLLQELHLELGMHCGDCHFYQDSHGDGNLYAAKVQSQQCEYCHGFVTPQIPVQKANWDAIEIECVDCHGDGLDHVLLDASLLDAVPMPAP